MKPKENNKPDDKRAEEKKPDYTPTTKQYQDIRKTDNHDRAEHREGQL